MDGNEQCSPNVKEAPNPSRPNEIQLTKLENGTTHICDTCSFCRM